MIFVLTLVGSAIVSFPPVVVGEEDLGSCDSLRSDDAQRDSLQALQFVIDGHTDGHYVMRMTMNVRITSDTLGQRMVLIHQSQRATSS